MMCVGEEVCAHLSMTVDIRTCVCVCVRAKWHISFILCVGISLHVIALHLCVRDLIHGAVW